ncbi:MAG: GNAT family N-acetyltransferase [Bacterioplanes sp.]|nr:GNAT family N-acetyltransferase [Bacterioplanes sp.]
MEVIFQLSEEQVKQLHQLYQTVWWAKGRSLEDTQKCVAGSQICIGLVDSNENLIGFTRILTDYIYKALLFDVIVCESHQGIGLGRKLVSLVKEHEQLQAVKHFELYCLAELEGFYEGHGFTAAMGDLQLMRCVNA